MTSNCTVNTDLIAMDALGLVQAMLGRLSSNNCLVDETSFIQFCERTFDQSNVIQEKQSPKYLFDTFFRDASNGKVNASVNRDRLILWLEELISKRKSALIIVDVQNDFIDGTLSLKKAPAGQDPKAVIEPINNLLDTVPFDLVVYTYDWHPENHISFIENVATRQIVPGSNANGSIKIGDSVRFLVGDKEVEQRLWPAHCIQNTSGAALHPQLRQINDSSRMIKVNKGEHPDADSYSAFFDNNHAFETELNRELVRRGITDLYICGLAYDVCVFATAQDALQLGYKTAVVDDCSRGLVEEDITAGKNGISKQNGIIVESRNVSDLVAGRRIPWSWAHSIAKRLFKK